MMKIVFAGLASMATALASCEGGDEMCLLQYSARVTTRALQPLVDDLKTRISDLSAAQKKKLIKSLDLKQLMTKNQFTMQDLQEMAKKSGVDSKATATGLVQTDTDDETDHKKKKGGHGWHNGHEDGAEVSDSDLDMIKKDIGTLNKQQIMDLAGSLDLKQMGSLFKQQEVAQMTQKMKGLTSMLQKLQTGMQGGADGGMPNMSGEGGMPDMSALQGMMGGSQGGMPDMSALQGMAGMDQAGGMPDMSALQMPGMGGEDMGDMGDMGY